MDVILKGGLHFESEKLCFNPKKDDFLDDEEEVCMVDTRASPIAIAIDKYSFVRC